jgi:GNAT superfamily N-acetyltransferase
MRNDRRNNTYIRGARLGDVPLLSGLIRDSFRDVAERFGLTSQNCPGHPSNCTEEWIQRELARGVKYFILEGDATPAGSVALEKADTDVCFLERLAVLPGERRKGFGRSLVDHVFGQARAVRAKQIRIGIIAEQRELKLWYQKIGFKAGEKKRFAHLPFLVMFMSYEL